MKKTVNTLKDLKVGKSAVVTGIRTTGSLKKQMCIRDSHSHGEVIQFEAAVIIFNFCLMAEIADDSEIYNRNREKNNG